MNVIPGVTSGPGTHALVVGISAYSNLPTGVLSPSPELLGLRQLESCALTAFRIVEWLQAHASELASPLASIRWLVAPSSVELAVEPQLKTVAHGCTFDDFALAADEWRKAVSSHPENQALFYFAGHGAQRLSGSHVMLMQDFGKGAAMFGKAVDTKQLIDGMKPSGGRPNMGLSQLFFVDCCRARPAFTWKFDQTPAGALWDTPAAEFDERSLTLIYAASAGRTAYSRKAQQTIFSVALLECLNERAARPRPSTPATPSAWHVSVHSLTTTIVKRVITLSSAIHKAQRCRIERLGDDTTISQLPAPPLVDVSIAVEPSLAAQFAELTVADRDDTLVASIGAPVDPHPFPRQLRAGLYQIRAKIAPPTPPFVDRNRLFEVGPQESNLVLPLT